MNTAIEIMDLEFSWQQDAAKLDLNIESFTLKRGERCFLVGASGSGKSTLLSLIGGVMLPQSGNINVLNQSIQSLSAAQRDHFRADHMGLIFQMFNLLPWLTVLENVQLAASFSKKRQVKAEERFGSVTEMSQYLLNALGMDKPTHGKKASELSVGQQQRVAVARALLGAPEIVIADEPTSALDAQHRDRFMELLFQECAEMQASLLFVSHDASLKQHFDQIVKLDQLHQSSGGQS